MTSFSDDFLSWFPPTRVSHSLPVCAVRYYGLELSPEEKSIIFKEIQTSTCTQQTMANYLGVTPIRIEKLVHDVRHGKRLSDTGGRSSKLDDYGKDLLCAEIIRRRESGAPMTKSELYLEVNQAVSSMDIRLGGNGLTTSVHKQTADKILSSMHGTAEKGQVTTKARQRESQDIRNFVSMAAMNEAYGSNKPCQLIGNYDATQFVVTVKNQELLITIKKESSNDSDDDMEERPLTNVEDSTLDFGIKWFMIASASGHLGTDVFLVNNPNMTDDEFTSSQIRGLSHRSDPTAFGYLCFCKTRCGNQKFFEWYTSVIVTSFVEQCRQLVPEDNRQQNFYMVADGEAIQVKPVEDDGIASILDSHMIDLGKGPASCTGTMGNACDRSNLFKASKKVLKSEKSLTVVDFEDPALEQVINAYISDSQSSLSAEKRRNISKGLIKVARSLARVVNFQIVSHGFQRIGVYPLDHTRCIRNMDEQVLRQYDKVTLDSIIAKIPQLAEVYLDEETGGQISESQMDEFGIPRTVNDDKRSAPKDQRSQSNQRAVMLSNPASRKRRKEWVRRHESKASGMKDSEAPANTDDDTSAGTKRKRKPNRPKAEIEAEKLAKAARKLEREAKVNH